MCEISVQTSTKFNENGDTSVHEKAQKGECDIVKGLITFIYSQMLVLALRYNECE